MSEHNGKALALPDNLPSVARAKLPASYEAAKLAIAECARIDECAEWADRMAAMASYAKQSQDETLMKTAVRIKARAIRRCGELLEKFQEHRGRTPAAELGPGPVPISRTEAARDAGLSKRQQKDAVRVARVPEREFEAAVESDKPPTVTELAERGTKKRPEPIAPLLGRTPEEVQAGSYGFGHLSRLAEFAAKTDPGMCARGELPPRRKQMRELAVAIQSWLVRLIKECER